MKNILLLLFTYILFANNNVDNVKSINLPINPDYSKIMWLGSKSMGANHKGLISLKEGNVVMYDQHAGHDIAYEDLMYRVIKLRDVVLVDEENNS